MYPRFCDYLGKTVRASDGSPALHRVLYWVSGEG